MNGLRKILRKFEEVMTAVTFAEAGEAETAREIMHDKEYTHEKPREKKLGDTKPAVLKPSYS